MGLLPSRTALSETSRRAPLKVESVRGRRSLPESRVVVELNTGEEGDCDDRRDGPIDNEAKRRPPASLGDELVAVLPQVLEPVAGKPSDEQPRGDSHADGGDRHERRGERALRGQSDFLPPTAWGKTSKGLTNRRAEWVVWSSEQAFE
jgi:hypothetical protein